MSEPSPLLIVGASARAAAQSAQRAGFAVTAIDLFADEDLAACASAIRCDDYPRGLVGLAARAPDGPWMYTGGLENHPRVVERISARRPLWGNAPDVLRAVRNPFEVSATLDREGLPTLEVRRDARDLPGDGTWFAKPIAGSGGGRIRVLDGHFVNCRKEPRYFQRRKRGKSASAVFVAARGQAVLLGASEQVIGEPWTGGKMFQYAGSIGPLEFDGRPLDDRLYDEITELGRVLAAEFGLTGLFGVDGILDGEHFWPVEVNPRYTASCEIVERLSGVNVVAAHAAACRESNLTAPADPHRQIHAAGKAIVFAPTDATFGERAAALVERLNAETPRRQAADTPRIGTRFSPGDPVLTVLAETERPADVRKKLMRLANDLRERLA
ncbi:MAG: ATP-grasp domain-containing protein [Pirellulales bacterium]